MDGAGKLKLGDFGIARDTHQVDLTDVGLTVGTYAYMSPEQICADTNISDKTDLYALGCLLYEMITGYQPFDGSNFARIFDQHLKSEPPRIRDKVPDAPEELEAMIIQLMAKHPAQRPFNARLVQGFLQDLLEKRGDCAASERPVITSFNFARPAGLSPYARYSWGNLIGLVGIIGLILTLTFLLKYFVFD